MARVRLLDLQPHDLCVRKAVEHLVEKHPADAVPLEGGTHVELVQHDDVAVAIGGGERHPCEPLAVVGDQEFRTGPRQPVLERGYGVPVVGDLGDAVGAAS
jgi:hypothetical protein